MDQTISVVIRTYNEEAFLDRVLDVLHAQEGVRATLDITVVDSGSTDATVAIARARSVRLIEIPHETFDYSDSLNLGISESVGNPVVILSAHAIPTTRSWLARTVAHFADQRVAGVFTRQIPWEGGCWREAARLQRTFGEASITFDAPPAGALVPFSNAASCIRRDLWQQHPFDMPAAEDTAWATWAVKDGHRIVYEAGVAVYHSHDEASRQEASRLITLEKAADIRMGRRRSLALTLRQGAGLLVRDTRDMFRYTRGAVTRVRILANSLMRSFWFVHDFGA